MDLCLEQHNNIFNATGCIRESSFGKYLLSGASQVASILRVVRT